MDRYIPSVQQMADINNTLHLLIIAFGGGAVTLVGVVVAQFKVFIPRTFKQRDEQRKIELEKLRQELENKRAAEAVDIERERLLPQLMEQNRIMQNTTVRLAESFNETMMHLVQQNSTNNSTMLAHTRAVTSVAEKQEEFRQIQETSTLNLQRLELVVAEARDASKTAAAFANRAADAGKEILEFLHKQNPPTSPATNVVNVNTGAVPEKPADVGGLENVA